MYILAITLSDVELYVTAAVSPIHQHATGLVPCIRVFVRRLLLARHVRYEGGPSCAGRSSQVNHMLPYFVFYIVNECSRMLCFI